MKKNTRYWLSSGATHTHTHALCSDDVSLVPLCTNTHRRGFATVLLWQGQHPRLRYSMQTSSARSRSPRQIHSCENKLRKRDDCLIRDGLGKALSTASGTVILTRLKSHGGVQHSGGHFHDPRLKWTWKLWSKPFFVVVAEQLQKLCVTRAASSTVYVLLCQSERGHGTCMNGEGVVCHTCSNSKQTCNRELSCRAISTAWGAVCAVVGLGYWEVNSQFKCHIWPSQSLTFHCSSRRASTINNNPRACMWHFKSTDTVTQVTIHKACSSLSAPPPRPSFPGWQPRQCYSPKSKNCLMESGEGENLE